MVRLTDTQLVILSAASQREDRGVEPLATVQGKAAGKVVAKLVRAGLLEEIKASGSLPVWRRDDESGAVALRITSAGLAVIDAADKAIAAPEESGSGLSSAGEAITSRKRISVFAQTSARRRHRSGKCAAKVTPARHDDQFECIACSFVAELWIFRGHPAHADTFEVSN